MNVEINRLLPIGTIVRLKNTNKNVMIMVNNVAAEIDDKNVRYDYSACLYPEGVINTENAILFNEKDIEEIINYGLITDEEFKIRLIVQNFASGIKLPFMTKEKEMIMREEMNKDK